MHRIFISHSSQDNAVAKSLKDYLEKHGHRSLFLDFDPKDGIPAGRNWEQELYQRIRNCQAMIVVCSHASMASRWCFMEITHARALGKPLLALRVDDCALDGVLTDHQAIDLTINAADGYDRLLRGIAAAGLDPTKTFWWDSTRPPYPGLLAFQEEDAGVYFGRSDEIAEGLELLNRIHHLGDPNGVMILGASGTGKSSLVRAGIIPRLRRDPNRWIVLDPFRPGGDPLGKLAAALNRSSSTDSADLLLRRSDPDVLVNALGKLQQRAQHPNAKVLLVIDQFEELFGSDDVQLFLTQLRRVIEDPNSPAVVLGTMRSDFLDRFQSSVPLLDLRYAVLSVGPMSESDVAEIIIEPAKAANVEVEARLSTKLISDAGTSNALPLLAFTLRELWERFANDGRITLEEYRDQLGGVQKVVGDAADNVLKAARVTVEQRRALRAAFLAMMRVTDDGKYARRGVKWNNLPETVHPLLERFVEARLLASGTEGSDRVVEVAHERLFDSWQQLRDWIGESVEALRLRSDIDDAAQQWSMLKQKDLLWRGARVTRARELLSDGTLLLDDTGRLFIEESEREIETREREERTRRRRVIVLVSSVAVVALVLAVIAFFAWRRARSSALLAEDRERSAKVDQFRALSAQSFAEYQRVLSRVQTEGVSEDEKKALTALAPKYLDQSKQYEEESKRLQRALDDWRRENGLQIATTAGLFTLEVFRAGPGTAFLVHYGNPASSRYLLIDGGSKRTYKDVLKPRFDALSAERKPLSLALVAATQTDFQHMEGLIALLDDLQKQSPSSRSINIEALWSNAFLPGPPNIWPDLVELQPKGRLIAKAKELQLPVNVPFKQMIAAPEAGSARVSLDDQLTITILSPRVQWLRQFADFWLKDLRRRGKRRDVDPQILAALDDYDIVETFAHTKIELLPSPIEIVNRPSQETLDEASVVNLASTVLMLELNRKRILLTADARADVILSALAQAGYTDDNGNMEVDVLILPHGGSDRNVSVDFFRRVKARNYVMSSDGTHTNPEVRTFEMLFEARRGDSQPFSIALTYAPEEYVKNYPVRDLCALLTREKNAGTPFEIITPKNQISLGIDLLSNVASVDKGARNAVCNVR